jgi:hypothetical protein
MLFIPVFRAKAVPIENKADKAKNAILLNFIKASFLIVKYLLQPRFATVGRETPCKYFYCADFPPKQKILHILLSIHNPHIRASRYFSNQKWTVLHNF